MIINVKTISGQDHISLKNKYWTPAIFTSPKIIIQYRPLYLHPNIHVYQTLIHMLL